MRTFRWLLLGVALLALLLVLRRLRPAAASTSSGPVLGVAPGGAGDEPPPEAIALALRAMTPAMRSDLAHALDDLDIDLDVASNPLAEPLDDRPPGADLEALTRTLLPVISAA